MLSSHPIFAELFGFVLFDLERLAAFQQRHNLSNDLLDAFVSSDLGTQVSREGTAIPISGVTADYYHFALRREGEAPYLPAHAATVRSDGWTLESTAGELLVCGIGYLKAFEAQKFGSNGSFLKFEIPVGWNELTITGGVDSASNPVYEILVRSSGAPPAFRANLEDNFEILGV